MNRLQPSLRIIPLLVLVLMLGGSFDAAGQSSRSYYRARNAYNHMRFGSSTHKYRRACKIMAKRRKANDSFISRTFRRKSFGGTMLTEPQ